MDGRPASCLELANYEGGPVQAIGDYRLALLGTMEVTQSTAGPYGVSFPSVASLAALRAQLSERIVDPGNAAKDQLAERIADWSPDQPLVPIGEADDLSSIVSALQVDGTIAGIAYSQDFTEDGHDPDGSWLHHAARSCT